MTTTPVLRSSGEAAAIVRLHRLTLLRKAREGKIRSVRSGNKVFFTDDAINEYLTDGETKSVKPARAPKYAGKK